MPVSVRPLLVPCLLPGEGGVGRGGVGGGGGLVCSARKIGEFKRPR